MLLAGLFFPRKLLFLTFYFEISLDLQKCWENCTENSYMYALDVSIFHNHRTTIRIRKLTLAQSYYINYRPYSDFTSLFTKVLFLFQNLLLLRHLQSVTPPQFSFFFFFWHLWRLPASHSYLYRISSRRFEFVWCFLIIKLKLYILGKKYREVIMYPFVTSYQRVCVVDTSDFWWR